MYTGSSEHSQRTRAGSIVIGRRGSSDHLRPSTCGVFWRDTQKLTLYLAILLQLIQQRYRLQHRKIFCKTWRRRRRPSSWWWPFWTEEGGTYSDCCRARCRHGQLDGIGRRRGEGDGGQSSVDGIPRVRRHRFWLVAAFTWFHRSLNSPINKYRFPLPSRLAPLPIPSHSLFPSNLPRVFLPIVRDDSARGGFIVLGIPIVTWPLLPGIDSTIINPIPFSAQVDRSLRYLLILFHPCARLSLEEGAPFGRDAICSLPRFRRNGRHRQMSLLATD
jgi:hypothetical protein